MNHYQFQKNLLGTALSSSINRKDWTTIDTIFFVDNFSHRYQEAITTNGESL